MVSPASEADLATWLAALRIDTAAWGQGGAKQVADLWHEIARGESTLHTNPPRREVALVQVNLRRGDLILLELAQEMRDGPVRRRMRPPAEKLVAGEAVTRAARRCLQEEIGVTAGQVSDVRELGAPAISEMDSPSYPGLVTRYLRHTVEAAVEGLPAEDFWRDNVAAGADPILRHLWGWRPAHEFAAEPSPAAAPD